MRALTRRIWGSYQGVARARTLPVTQFVTPRDIVSTLTLTAEDFRMRFPCSLVAATLATLLAAPTAPVMAQPRGAAPPRAPAQDPLRFQMMGPSSGGRISAVASPPGDARVWYLGAASGGVWKSVDSGATFVPVFDRQPVQAIGALAVAPTRPAMVWAGTGEAWAIREADVTGDGIYLSNDAGATWTNMGLRETGRIGRILVHPTDPNIVYACALGRTTGPQQERGVYRTTDAGKNWTRVLFVDANTGCSGLNLDPKNPRTLYAGMWQVEMHPWAMLSGGPSSGIYKTTDGGDSWTRVSHPGLPTGPLGKIDVILAPSDSRRVYALIQTKDQGSLWRSDDAGATWRVVNWQRPLIGRAGYYIKLDVNPRNADEILVANSSFWRSQNGGTTFEEVPWGGDNHDIWWDPKNPDRFGLTNDAGARLTTDHGRTWISVGLPIAQMYHVAVDNRIPYWVYSNRQDNGTMRGPSTVPEATTGTRGIAAPDRRPAGAGAGSRRPPRRRRAAPTRSSPRRARSAAPCRTIRRRSAGWGCGSPATRRRATRPPRRPSAAGAAASASAAARRGTTTSAGVSPGSRFPTRRRTTSSGRRATATRSRAGRRRPASRARSAPGSHTLDAPPNELKYRCHWTAPLAIDPFDHNTVYYGCQVIFKTSNGGQSWSVISPDLSTRDPSRVVPSGGIVGDNLGQFYGEIVFAIAPSEIQRGLIWAGTNDGKVWNTRDGGATWNDVTRNVRGMPEWGMVRKIEPSRFDPATAYVAVDAHVMDDRRPHIFKTADYGRTWTEVHGDLPSDHPLSYVLAVAENPNKRGMLFAGTGHGFYYSLDDGAHWTQFDEGLPAAPVTWVVVPKLWRDVVVSTYGRGIYILKDITPLEQGGCPRRSRARRLQRRRGCSRRTPATARRGAGASTSRSRCRPRPRSRCCSTCWTRPARASGRSPCRRAPA